MATDLSTYSANLTTFLNTYLASLRTPITTLKTKKSNLQLKYGIFTDLKTKLQSLDTAVDSLGQSGTLSAFRTKGVSSSNSAVVTATATASAARGSHTVAVSQLATAHTVVSDRYDSAGTTLATSLSGTKTFSIGVDGETYDVSVTITSGMTNREVLSAIATAINSASDGEVTASAVGDTPSTSKLSIRSGTTGTAGKMTFTDTSGALGTLGATNGSAATSTVGGYIYADLGSNELDAKATIDGIEIISSDNEVSDAITGVTLNLLAAQAEDARPVTVTVTMDLKAIKTDIEDFITKYNDAFSYLVTKTNVDSDTYERAALAGDFPYVSLRVGMRQAMVSPVVTGSPSYQALSQLGITCDRSGTFSISDSDLLETALAKNLDAVESIFASDGGIATTLQSLLNSYCGSGGNISASQDAVNTRIDYIDDAIARQEAYVSRREKSLRQQYAALQEALYTQENTESMISKFSSIWGL
jgi:flagellar hook-associated protein 2